MSLGKIDPVVIKEEFEKLQARESTLKFMNKDLFDRLEKQLGQIQELEQKLAESELNNKEMSETIKAVEKNFNTEVKAMVIRCVGAKASQLLELDQKFSEALEVIRFYHDNTRDDLHCEILDDRATDKRAREFLKKHEGGK